MTRWPSRRGWNAVSRRARPTSNGLAADVAPFQAAAYERTSEVIAAGHEAICGSPGRVSIVDLATTAGALVADGRRRRGGFGRGGRIAAVATSGSAVLALLRRDKRPDREPPPQPTRLAAADTGSDQTANSCGRDSSGDGIRRRLLPGPGLRRRPVGAGTGPAVGSASDRHRRRSGQGRRRLDAAGRGGRLRHSRHRSPGEPADDRLPAVLRRSDRLVAAACRPRRQEPIRTEIQRLQRPYRRRRLLGIAGESARSSAAGRWTAPARGRIRIPTPPTRSAPPISWSAVRWKRCLVSRRRAGNPRPARPGPGPAVQPRCTWSSKACTACVRLDAYNGRTRWVYPIPEHPGGLGRRASRRRRGRHGQQFLPERRRGLRANRPTAA